MYTSLIQGTSRGQKNCKILLRATPYEYISKTQSTNDIPHTKVNLSVGEFGNRFFKLHFCLLVVLATLLNSNYDFYCYQHFLFLLLEQAILSQLESQICSGSYLGLIQTHLAAFWLLSCSMSPTRFS